MTTPFTKPVEDFLKSVQVGQLPQNLQSLVQDNVAKSRDATFKSLAAAKDGAESLEQFAVAAQKDAKVLAQKVLDNVAALTEASFLAVQAIASAKNLSEAAKLQAAFVQAQLAKAGEQTKELFDLSTKLAHQQVAAFNALAANSFPQLKA